MNIREQIKQNQSKELSIHIGIDNMLIKNDLKQRVIDAVMRGEDFALINDSGSYAYFLIEGFMCYVSADHQADSVTHLKDKKSWENALKVTLLGHRKFVSQKALMLNTNYVFLKEGLKREQLILK